MTTALMLGLHNFIEEFTIKYDALSSRIGAVLMQKRKPLAYFNKALSDGNLAKSIYEKELMTLVLVVQHWRPYLLGCKFRVFEDQKALRHLLEQRITTLYQQNRLAKLLGYDIEVLYQPGHDNKATYTFSYLPKHT